MAVDENLIDDLQSQLPIALRSYDLSARQVGLVVVDVIHGFCTVGAGALAPAEHNEAIHGMVQETDKVARRFADQKWPILAFVDSHEPGKPEFPYPLHCEQGSGEDELMPEIAWLEDCGCATVMRKDCINGFVGGIEASYAGGAHGQSHNKVVDWINSHRLEAVVVVGICTDICVMDFVLTLLSARNHGLMPTLVDIVVYEPATATYDLPIDRALGLGLPAGAAHPQTETHHMGLYFMASRGALLADALS
ncbi:MAG: isochorismatase family protein [Pseudomonadota bacterium]